MKKNTLLLFVVAASLIKPVFAQTKLPPFYSRESELWADSVFNTLSNKQRIGQLFMISTWSNRDSNHVHEIDSMLSNYYVGGLIFFQGGPVREAILTNHYQSVSKVPLLIAMDAEWGISMRLDSTMRFPRQMTLGAMPYKNNIYLMGAEIARQCKLVGINVNFAPDVDINNNPLNPVINSRSFGENKNDVALAGYLYMKGMQDNQVLACAKHFPGHGNTETDSHFALPIVNQPAAEIDSVELMPFKALIDQGVGSVMVAHLSVPALDSTPNLASTLSPIIIDSILKKQNGFKGIIFTDALNMKGVMNNNKPGEIELNALKAGNDILLCTESVPLALSLIDSAMLDGELDSNAVFLSVKKILQMKYWCGLNNLKPLETDKLYEKLNNSPEAAWLNYQLYRDGITLINNHNRALPLYSYKEINLASLVVNDTLNNHFQNFLSKYAHADLLRMNKETSENEFDSLLRVLREYKTVIISVHNTSTKASINFGIGPRLDELIEKLNDQTKVIVVVFGNSYTLSKLPHALDSKALVLSYEDTYLPNVLTAQMLFGAFAPTGSIPVSPMQEIPFRTGIHAYDVPRVIEYSLPEKFSISSQKLSMIDSIAIHAIADTAMPGCQIAVAYKGTLIYNKSFGTFTYKDSTKVTNNNLYDIASVTKIASTALATMYLYDKGKIDLFKKLSKYLPELKNTNKKDMLLQDVLTHQAGLQSWIPFYQSTLDSAGNLDTNIYRKVSEEQFSTQVADSLFIRNDYSKIIWQKIIDSDVKSPGNYVYSDLGMIIMQHIIERMVDMPIDSFVKGIFYEPLGLQRLTFHPLNHFNKNEIIPTEDDTVFRHQLLQGYVHDPAAAMLGGVAGNAGVFSNAENLTVLMQMLLQKGFYGGKQYIKKETVELFTKQFYPGVGNRRALFFDKPEPDKTKASPAAKSASPATFGHQGFTGTCVWVDPDKNLVYVFLSNRVNPWAANTKLANHNIRTDIMQVVYDAIK